MPELENSWRQLLKDELSAPYFRTLSARIAAEYAEHTVFPPAECIFRAFELTPVDRVKAVIIGQDPYHEPGQAQGLAFYVPPAVKPPPSLKNIARELASEYPESHSNGLPPDLVSWAKQGVLLINATLTVRAGEAGSHQKLGWEEFTDAAIRRLSATRQNLVFILWGAFAGKKAALIDAKKHLILSSAHPSPLSARRGFFGSNHFRMTNEYLMANGQTPIDW